MQFAKYEEILQSARNQEASVSVRQYARSCRAKCYFRGIANVFVVDLKLRLISILFTIVDYTVFLMYCPTSGAKCKRLNILINEWVHFRWVPYMDENVERLPLITTIIAIEELNVNSNPNRILLNTTGINYTSTKTKSLQLTPWYMFVQ